MTPKNKRTIVLVEDEEILSNMYKMKLIKSGYEVQTANDGKAGLDLIKKVQPDVVLLDIIMPKLDGFAVLEALHQEDITKDIPIILLTNLGQEEDIKRGKELGAVGYYVKANLTPGELVDKLNKFIKK
ncbi:MAG: response regulator [Candidatus Komeilibacteria bacterium]